jgi:hypothetical protein
MMHATLRAFGAEYRNTNGFDPDDWGRSDPFLKATNRSTLVSNHYQLDVNRLHYFLPWPREAWISGEIAGPRYDKPPGPLYPKKRGGLAFIVSWPSWIDPNPNVKSIGSCPPVPGNDLAGGFPSPLIKRDSDARESFWSRSLLFSVDTGAGHMYLVCNGPCVEVQLSAAASD